MSTDIDARISRLMDQLMSPGLRPEDAARIEGKIRFLREQA